MIDLNELKMLISVPGPCLTIFVPLRDAFSQVTRAETRLTTAAQQADELLAAGGMDEMNRVNFLRPILKLAKNTDFSGRTGSLTIFRAPDMTRASFWPEILETRVALGEEFFILPLLRTLNMHQSFWVLALSIKDVRLLRGTLRDLVEVELPPALPRNLREAESLSPPEVSLAGHSSPGQANGQSGAVHFGTFSLREKQHAYLRNFFKMVEREIRPLLDRSGEPLIIVAVPRELAIYREINKYTGLLPQAIHSSPDALSEHLLHEKALAILAEYRSVSTQKAQSQMEEAAGRGLLEIEIDTVLEASRNGLVKQLFVAPETHVNEETLNSAALAVIGNSGAVTRADLPDGRTAAAILRYRLDATSAPVDSRPA